jgi:uncharacterized ParB-like nuclease family protein
MKIVKRITERDMSKLVRRVIKEDEMDLSPVNKLGEIEGVSEIQGCGGDKFDANMCLSNAMDTLPFNKFVKEFFPAFQGVAQVTKTEIPTSQMDLPTMAEGRIRYKGKR